MKNNPRLKQILSMCLTSILGCLLMVGVDIVWHDSTAYADLGKSYREAEQLSNRDKLKFATDSRNEMQKALKYTLQELQASFDNKDIVQTNCIKLKLSTMTRTLC